MLKDSKLLISENIAISNLDVLNGQIFIPIDRTSKPGIPASLNTVIKKTGNFLLKPFPNLRMNRIGDCNSIQSAISVNIDPNTNLIWIIDEGVVNKVRFLRRKLITFDIRTRREVFRHIFPESVISESLKLFDLTLDREQDLTRYAYIVDSLSFKLIVLDTITNKSRWFSHPSMEAEESAGNITINGETIFSRGGINSISISSDFKFVYYFSVASFKTWQIPTSILRDCSSDNNTFAANVRMVGIRQHHAVSLTSGTRSFFFPAVPTTALNWVFGMHIDNGYLFFITNKLYKIRLETMDFSGNDGPNFSLQKIFVGEGSYLLGK
ncbi:protein yellow-like [Mytilus trossulus]|uniref:protein yellow-like n=1 Tax=Mytilus trossulus TaxID=6551 RepID=UPI00300624C6